VRKSPLTPQRPILDAMLQQAQVKLKKTEEVASVIAAHDAYMFTK